MKLSEIDIRHPIDDIPAWLERQPPDVRTALQALGELLIGVAEQEGAETADAFAARCLGVDECAHLIHEVRPLSAVARLTTALALAEWMDAYSPVCEIGPGLYGDPPKWGETDIGEWRYRHPLCLSVHFPAGTLIDGPGCVIHLNAQARYGEHSAVSVYAVPAAQEAARTVLDHLADRANALNPYRGRAVRASLGNGLQLTVIELPDTATRENVIVGEDVWAEIGLGVVAVRDRHEMLNAHGLGARRGVLLCGPPGTGKSAVSTVVAREVVGDFTVIYVEAKAGAELLTAVVHEAQWLGGPVLIILEDVDLWCHDRTVSGSGLSELLQAMDINPEARILTLASTNDVATLDKAAIRTGRFDAVVEVGYPKRSDAARILAALVPDGAVVDTEAVAAALPERTSGSDLREIVRRAVLTGDGGNLSTAALLAEVGNGRYAAKVPDGGMYL